MKKSLTAWSWDLRIVVNLCLVSWMMWSIFAFLWPSFNKWRMFVNFKYIRQNRSWSHGKARKRVIVRSEGLSKIKRIDLLKNNKELRIYKNWQFIHSILISTRWTHPYFWPCSWWQSCILLLNFWRVCRQNAFLSHFRDNLIILKAVRRQSWVHNSTARNSVEPAI